MKVAVLVLCATVALAAAKPREEVAEEEVEIELNSEGCPVDPEIAQLLPSEYCHKFYQCVSGVPVEKICPYDLMFNIELQTCDWPLDVDCGERIITDDRPKPAETEEDETETPINGHSDPSLAPEICAAADSSGVLVAHEICTSFYKCDVGIPVALKCPEPLFYNPNNEQCDWFVNVDCGDRLIPEVEDDEDKSDAERACAERTSEGVLVTHENCNSFYKCSGGLPVAFNCSRGLLYDTVQQWCDWPANVDCGSRPIVVDEESDNENVTENGNGAWVPQHGYDDPSKAPEICAAAESDGVLVAHENCSQFYQCSRRVPVAMSCAAGLYYHPALEVCDWPTNVDCNDRLT